MVKFLKARLFDQRAVNSVSEPTQTQLVPAHLGASVPDGQKLRVEAMFRKLDPSPPLLTVISWGSAASHWLTRTLNELQGLFALHSSRLTLRGLVAADLDDVTYMKLIGEFASGSRTAGDVHGVDRYSVEHLNREFGEHIHCYFLVRDPIPRLKSQLAHSECLQFRPHAEISDTSKRYPELDTIIPEKTYENYAFANACNMLNAIADEMKVGPIFGMEDIIASPIELRKTVYFIGHVMSVALEVLKYLLESGKSKTRSQKSSRVFVSWQHECLD